MSLESALFAFLFFLPAGISNMTPVFSSRIPVLKNWQTPLDFGKSYRGHRIFGRNKSWRGLVSGTIAGTLTGLILNLTYFTEYNMALFLALCASMSAGALLGDAIESFFKRQRGIDSGKTWFPFDQLDYIIGGLLFALPFATLSLESVLWIFGLYFGLHLITSYIGYLLGFKDAPI